MKPGEMEEPGKRSETWFRSLEPRGTRKGRSAQKMNPGQRTTLLRRERKNPVISVRSLEKKKTRTGTGRTQHEKHARGGGGSAFGACKMVGEKEGCRGCGVV